MMAIHEESSALKNELRESVADWNFGIADRLQGIRKIDLYALVALLVSMSSVFICAYWFIPILELKSALAYITGLSTNSVDDSYVILVFIAVAVLLVAVTSRLTYRLAVFFGRINFEKNIDRAFFQDSLLPHHALLASSPSYQRIHTAYQQRSTLSLFDALLVINRSFDAPNQITMEIF
jgi:hypothetical protein